MSPEPNRATPRPAGADLADAQERYREGARHLERGRCVEAVACLLDAARRLPDRAEVWTRLGAAWVGIDRSDQARACFERSLALAPAQPALWSNLGLMLHHAGDSEGGLGCIQRALELQPGLLAARRNAALALHALGRSEAADRLLPATLDSLLLKAEALRERGDLDGATATYRAAIGRLERGEAPPPAAAAPVFRPESGRQVLLEAKARLDAAGIPFFLLAGTLLGVVRDGDLLAHDKDLDLGLPWDVDRSQVVTALCTGGAFTVPWYRGILPADRPWYRSFNHAETGCALDGFFLKPEEGHLLCGFDNRPVPVLSRLRPFKLRGQVWLDRTWQVPDPPEQYLEDVYGSGWRVPDPHYDTILSNPLRTAESLPVVLCSSYHRLYEAMLERKWARARALVGQILARREDPFLVDLGDRLRGRIPSPLPAEAADG